MNILGWLMLIVNYPFATPFVFGRSFGISDCADVKPGLTMKLPKHSSSAEELQLRSCCPVLPVASCSLFPGVAMSQWGLDFGLPSTRCPLSQTNCLVKKTTWRQPLHCPSGFKFVFGSWTPWRRLDITQQRSATKRGQHRCIDCWVETARLRAKNHRLLIWRNLLRRAQFVWGPGSPHTFIDIYMIFIVCTFKYDFVWVYV